MKIAVVTSSIGSNELLEPIKYKGVDYHAFTDNPSPHWTNHPIIPFSVDTRFANRRNAKVYKILPFAFLPGYDYYFWVDATHRLETDPHYVITKYLSNSDIAVFKHADRNCIYLEAKGVISVNFDHSNLVQDQVAFYRNMEYPNNNGLYELPARVQRNSPLTQRLGWMWWEQICMFSSRDQISFPFCLHQLGIKPSILPGTANCIRGNDIMPQLVYSHHRRT